MRMPALAMLALLLSLATTRVGAQPYQPAFHTIDCPESLYTATASPKAIRCGWLQTPENRAEPNGNWLQVFVVVIESPQDVESAPLLVLAGGPGDAASADANMWLASDLHQHHDIILVDQRGAGMSQPSLDCPESSHSDDDAWISACRERLIGKGVNLSAYHAMSIVWDIHDLLTALKLEQVNLYGNSYGSRLALLLADIAPKRIRSLVLDGVYPPPKNDIADLAHNSEQLLTRFFDDCRAAPACNNAPADLEEKFYTVVAEMNKTPPQLNNRGESSGFYASGDEFLLWTIEMLRYPDVIPVLPALIASFHDGYYDLLLSVDAYVQARHRHEEDRHSEGLYLSVRCADNLAFEAASRWQANHKLARAEIANALSPIARQHFQDCAAWDARPPPAQLAKTVQSDVPALLLSGAYDRATPPSYGDYARQHLNISWHYRFPAAGHGVLKTESCAAIIVLAFLANPNQQPARGCLSALQPPDFAMTQRG